jgi:trimeric autotransporter adhesin
MSTKTLRKRIALVAVSALGFGLLSVAPSSALSTDVPSSALAATGIARDATGMTITFTGNATIGTGAAWDAEFAHYRLVSTTATPVATANPIAIPTGQVALGLVSEVLALRNKGTVNLAHNGTTINLRPGTYTFLAWVNTTDDAAQAAPAVGDVTTRFSVTVAGAPASITLTSPAAAVAASATTNAAYVATVKDANGVNTLLGTDETVTVRATYSAGALVIGATTAVSGASLVTATTTALSSSNATASGSAGYINNWSFALANSLPTATTVAVAGAGLLAGITGATSTLTTIAKSYPTSVDVSGGTTFNNDAITIGVGAGATLTAPVAQTAATTGYGVTASTVHGLSATFRAVGAAAATFEYTIAAISTTTPLPTGITVGTYTTGAVGSTDLWTNFTITATAATAGSGYKVTIPFDATTNIVFNVTYAAPTVNSGLGTVVMTPVSGDGAKALIGSSVTVTATVKDQFGKAFAGANVVWSASARKTTNVATNAVTNASGQATYSYTDTVATAGSETFYADVSAPTAITVLRGTTSVAFGAAATVAVNTLTLTSNKVAAATGNVIDAVITETVTLRDANGAALSGIPVTMSISENGYAVSTTLTAWTNSSGQVAMQFAGKTVGTATVTATAGDKSATDDIVVITNATKARTITLSDATIAITGGDTKKITATVRDIYGNVVAGEALTVSYIGTAGRVSAVNGVIGAGGSTGTAGTVVIDITAALGESGTGTLTVAGADFYQDTTAANAAYLLAGNDDGSDAVALVKSVTSTATITASTATADANKALLDVIAALQAKIAADKIATDAAIAANAAKAAADTAAAQAAAVAAAEAAADAAAEAIDAGNNAFDAATSAGEAADAATAAAEQAGEDATAAATAAGEAAVAAAEAAQEAAAEATDAANAATDAANASAEAADAATAAAQDAADAVAVLSTQVSEMVSALKKQITALTNLVIKIQKKVKA